MVVCDPRCRWDLYTLNQNTLTTGCEFALVPLLFYSFWPFIYQFLAHFNYSKFQCVFLFVQSGLHFFLLLLLVLSILNEWMCIFWPSLAVNANIEIQKTKKSKSISKNCKTKKILQLTYQGASSSVQIYIRSLAAVFHFFFFQHHDRMVQIDSIVMC